MTPGIVDFSISSLLRQDHIHTMATKHLDYQATFCFVRLVLDRDFATFNGSVLISCIAAFEDRKKGL